MQNSKLNLIKTKSNNNNNSIIHILEKEKLNKTEENFLDISKINTNNININCNNTETDELVSPNIHVQIFLQNENQNLREKLKSLTLTLKKLNAKSFKERNLNKKDGLKEEQKKIEEDIYLKKNNNNINLKAIKISDLNTKEENFNFNIKKEDLIINFLKLKAEKQKIELDLMYKLYFIRFSNSLLRAIFNIINIRRFQIKIYKTKNLKEEQRKNLQIKFEELNKLENIFNAEFQDFLILYK